MGLRDDVRKYGLKGLGALVDLAGIALAKANGATDGGDSNGSGRILGGTNEDTAQNHPIPTEKATDGPKALLWDPFSIVEQLGYKDKPSAITYGTLKAITYKMPIIQAIIQTRINQIASFCMPQQDRYKLGFKVRTRDNRKKPSKAEQEWGAQAEMLLMRTGVTDNPRGRDNFEKFIRKISYDMLTYDQMCFEIVPNRKGTPAEWYAVDGATIRLADTASSHFDEDKTDAVKYVQIYDGMIITEYTQNELCFGVRNPRTDIRLQGYGISEIEMMIPVITALLYSWEFNQKFFTQGSATKGILNFKGTIPERELQNFRKQWYTQIASVENAWRTPITNSEDLQYINIQASARDMEFNAWMDFLIKVACAMYAIDPVEVNFKYGNVGQRSGLHESNNKDKITESKERGLRPLLRFLANAINQYIIWPMNESFEFAFVGLDAHTRDEEVDINTKRVKSVKTVDEIRAEEDLEPLPDGKGEVILDSVWMQFSQTKESANQQQQPGAGPPGEEQGQGAPEGEAPEENQGDEEGANSEYEKMLAQFQDEEGEEEGDEGKESEKSSMRVGEDLVKSQRRKWIVNI